MIQLGPTNIYMIVDLLTPYYIILPENSGGENPKNVQRMLDRIYYLHSLVIPNDVEMREDEEHPGKFLFEYINDDGDGTEDYADPSTFERREMTDEKILDEFQNQFYRSIVIPANEVTMFEPAIMQTQSDKDGQLLSNEYGYFKGNDDKGFYLYVHPERIPYSLLSEAQIEQWKRRPTLEQMQASLSSQFDALKKRKEAGMKRFVIKQILAVDNGQPKKEFAIRKVELQLKKVVPTPPPTPVLTVIQPNGGK